MIIYFQAGTFLAFVIASAVFGGVVFVTSAFAIAIQFGHGDAPDYYRICDALCKSQKAIGFSILALGIVGCIIGCAGCCCVTTSPGQVKNNIKNGVCNFLNINLYFFCSLDNTHAI